LHLFLVLEMIEWSIGSGHYSREDRKNLDQDRSVFVEQNGEKELEGPELLIFFWEELIFMYFPDEIICDFLSDDLTIGIRFFEYFSRRSKMHIVGWN